MTRQRIYTDRNKFRLPVALNSLEDMEMTRDIRGDPLVREELLDDGTQFDWSSDSNKTLDQWLAQCNWLGITNRQVWGISLIRALEMMKEAMPKRRGTNTPNTDNQVSLRMFW